MFVKPIEIQVCKPCPHCGMPTIKQYAWQDGIRYSITCDKRCHYIGNVTRNIEDAIRAWNVLIAGPQKPPSISEAPYHVVQYERRVKQVKKYGGAVLIPHLMLTHMDVHTRQRVIHEETKGAYHKIADKLFSDGIGRVEQVKDEFVNGVMLRVSLQVVDDKS